MMRRFFAMSLFLLPISGLPATDEHAESVAAENAKNNSPAEKSDPLKADSPLTPELKSTEKLEDPTRMNDNFRAALQNRGRAQSKPDGSTTATQDLPKISLVASVCGRHGAHASAMLRIGDNTQIVRTGDKITHFQNSQLFEIHVLEVHRRYVRLMVLPNNETIILR